MTAFTINSAALTLLVPLFREICDLKRIYVAHSSGSIAERGFRRAWARLVAGEPASVVALSETAACLAAVRLGGLDAAVLASVGLDRAQRRQVLVEALSQHQGVVAPDLNARLKASLDEEPDVGDATPPFVEALARQPRAGATSPGRARIVLEPAENHAEHCYITAVFAVLCSPIVVLNDPGQVFVAALAHHLHNAELPDGGFAGETLLGDMLEPIMERTTVRALGQLEENLSIDVSAARDAVLKQPRTPAGMAFQIGDVLDRVLQIEHYATASQFELSHALDELDLVHAGPLQAMQNDILIAAGLVSHGSREPDQRASAAA